ncbi:MAG: ribosome-binding factor A [Candidatus Pacebacteria bacterium]|jgi:ribosome-binding factor A|nr:hypothetical protein [bacterium]MDP6527831.1 ribosome-binding factor A [Candidatus Paceibacterota bacterium]MDP6659814.1 ribosome-binding factor A [Candidatus Paceibacterota bacterium]|tara:strand:- start:1250 stop:1570 length:321 start_codon:yes stop_codon:yes gene_type:complete
MTDRKDKTEALIRELAAEFLSREANRTSMITVTGARLTKNKRHATVSLSVLPEEAEEQVIHFARRKRSEFKEYLKKRLSASRIPFVDFEIDQGEKNRRRIEELSNE